MNVFEKLADLLQPLYAEQVMTVWNLDGKMLEQLPLIQLTNSTEFRRTSVIGNWHVNVGISMGAIPSAGGGLQNRQVEWVYAFENMD